MFEDPYCSLHVHGPGGEPELVRVIEALSDARTGGVRFRAAEALLEVRENDDFDPDQVSDPENGFLFYRFLVEVEPLSAATQEAYVAAVAALIRGLRREGWSVVPACDFEDLLPPP